MSKIILSIFVLVSILGFWYWVDDEDYFNADYKNVSTANLQVLEWQEGDDSKCLRKGYIKNMNKYLFPGQEVVRVERFQNTPIVNLLTSKVLKKEYTREFMLFCNDTTNFNWKETTWQPSESEYYCRFYNEDGKVIGKMYFCLKGCGMTNSVPFSPRMKFGGLSDKGLSCINQIFDDQTKWK